MKINYLRVQVLFVIAALIGTFCSAGRALPARAQELPATYSIRLNIAALELTLLQGGAPVKRYPVAVGKPASPSPTGEYTIVSKAINPTWIPTDGSPPVPPGPDNPLGSRWMGLSKPHYGIHSTNAPSSIGRAVSLGCFRMRPQDVEELYSIVPVGTKVSIVYERIEVIPDKEGILVRVFADIYRRGAPSLESVNALVIAQTEGLSGLDRDAITKGIVTKLGANEKSETTVALAKGAEVSSVTTTARKNGTGGRPEFSVSINGTRLPADSVIGPEGTGHLTSLSPEVVQSIKVSLHESVKAASLTFFIDGDIAYINDVATPISRIGNRSYITVGRLMSLSRCSYTYTANNDKIAISLVVSRVGRDE